MSIEELKPSIVRIVNELAKEDIVNYPTADDFLVRGCTRDKKVQIIENITKCYEIFLRYGEDISNHSRFLELVRDELGQNDRFKSYEKLVGLDPLYIYYPNSRDYLIFQEENKVMYIFIKMLKRAMDKKLWRLKERIINSSITFYREFLDKIEKQLELANQEKNNDKLFAMHRYRFSVNLRLSDIESTTTKREWAIYQTRFNELRDNIRRLAKEYYDPFYN